MSTQSAKGLPPEGLAHAIAAAFADFGPLYRRLVTSGVADPATTFARAKAMHVLACNGAMIMSRLRDELGITARSVTALVDGLEEDGHARRIPHPSDRRATIIELTEHGRHVVDEVHHAFTDRAARIFDELEEDDQRDLLRVMRRVVKIVRRHAQVELRPTDGGGAPATRGGEPAVKG